MYTSPISILQRCDRFQRLHQTKDKREQGRLTFILMREQPLCLHSHYALRLEDAAQGLITASPTSLSMLSDLINHV